MSINFKIFRLPVIVCAALLFLLTLGMTIAAVDPPSVSEILVPGADVTVEKTVDTPEIPPKPDIVFLADTTGSMGGAIANVKANATDIMDAVLAVQSDAQFAVANYEDDPDDCGIPSDDIYVISQDITNSKTDVQNAINLWAANPGSGGDLPEAQLCALSAIANSAVSFRTNSTPIIVWFGDATGHDPCPCGSGPFGLGGVISDLQAAGIKVIAIAVDGSDPTSLDADGQATAITNATGGSLEAADPDGVADAILAGLQNLPITVTPVPVVCDPLVITFDPESQTVTSGEQVVFAETIAVPADATSLAGCEVHCTVDFQDENGNVIGTQDIWIEIPIEIDLDPDTVRNELGTPGQTHTVTATVTSDETVPIPGAVVVFEILSGPNAGASGNDTTDANGEASFTYTATQGPSGLGTDVIEACLTDDCDHTICDDVIKEWVDTTPPEVGCLETVNPHGNRTPPAGSTTLPGPRGGQNEDGFYALHAEDAVDPDPQIFVSGFGPFFDGDKVKVTEDPDATEESKKIGSTTGRAGAIAAHLILNADPVVIAVDGSGNVSAPVDCLVPGPPK